MRPPDAHNVFGAGIPAMALFDAHCHLQDKRIIGGIGDIINNARHSNIRRVLCCGTKEDDWDDVAKIKARYSGGGVLVSCAYGVHPWHVDHAGNNWDAALKEYLLRDPSAAVGEIGLDNSAGQRNDDRQAAVFTRQLEIADLFKRPVSIHCRKAWGTLIPILKGRGGLRFGGAIHSYSGPPDLVSTLQNLGCSISFSGSILIHGNKRAVESLKLVSLDRLLIETDSPDILPPNLPGPYNEPANILPVLGKVAEILEEAPLEVARLTYDNALSLFSRS